MGGVSTSHPVHRLEELLPYLSEVTDLRFELEAIEQQLDRFEYALQVLERAVLADPRQLDPQAASDVRLDGYVSRFEAALKKASSLLAQLVSVADQLDAAAQRSSSPLADGLSIPEAKRTVSDVTAGMDSLIATWKAIRDRIGFDLLRISSAVASDQPRWGEHWPFDADLARELAAEDFGLKERDKLILTFYYGRGLTQSQIADACIRALGARRDRGR